MTPLATKRRTMRTCDDIPPVLTEFEHSVVTGDYIPPVPKAANFDSVHSVSDDSYAAWRDFADGNWTY